MKVAMSGEARRILGIDPGSRLMGYAVIEVTSKTTRCLLHETLKLHHLEAPAEKLGLIFSTLSQVVQSYQPHEAAIEQVFVQKNVQSALKLGQARGAAMAAFGVHQIPVFEYAARQIKQAVVGTGAAEKQQVQHMVKILVNLLTEKLLPDSADALAVALCHHFHYKSHIHSLSSSL